MPSPVVVPVEQIVASEQAYLYSSDAPGTSCPTWAAAACREADPELFFPIGRGDVGRTRLAIAFCNRCQVKETCLEFAMRDRHLVGIWGGTDEEDRARRRGRFRSVVHD